ncbi:CsgG/HfaB family protein [bacterium]|nr:CsgG/HfaB family protein [bacterium]
MRAPLVTLLIAVVLISGCASVSTEKGPETQARKTLKQKGFTFPPYSGPKKRIQVVRFGIPADVASKYPELADKRVGWGLCNRIVDGLWQTNRFEFIEEKEEILQKMLDQWQLSSAGIVTEETAIEQGSLKAPQYLVYAEVFDFGVSHSEQIVGVAAKQMDTTVIGVQIRMVDVATGQYIPASATGEAKTSGVGIWASVNLEFDQTTVGLASQDAVNEAIISLINRLK